eukprot:5739203-Pyramimonas_sp.AAC.1
MRVVVVRNNFAIMCMGFHALQPLLSVAFVFVVVVGVLQVRVVIPYSSPPALGNVPREEYRLCVGKI